MNVEEGRHLWAMVYLLHKYFGRDGREEANELLRAARGDPDKPRILGRLQPADAGLALIPHVHVLHGSRRKIQLERLARVGIRSALAHLSFMLTEEAHHMFVGETGISRTAQRTCEAMKEAGIEDPNEISRSARSA